MRDVALGPGNLPISRPAARFRQRAAVGALLWVLTSVAGLAAGEFPFDQELMLDAAPMGRVKRLPMLVVSPNGDATVQLWCRDASARVRITDDAITVEPAPLPDALPAVMSDGQCSPERLQADIDTLAALAQVSGWQTAGDSLILNGPTTLRFLRSSH